MVRREVGGGRREGGWEKKKGAGETTRAGNRRGVASLFGWRLLLLALSFRVCLAPLLAKLRV